LDNVYNHQCSDRLIPKFRVWLFYDSDTAHHRPLYSMLTTNGRPDWYWLCLILLYVTCPPTLR